MATTPITTETQAANLALIRIGKPGNISDLDSDTDKTATAARLLFPDTRDEVASILPWSSLVSRTAISTTTASGESLFDYKQTLADSVLRVIDIIDLSGTENYDWRREQTTIYYNATTGFIRHIDRVASVTVWDPLFVSAFVARLGHKLALHLTSNLQIAAMLQQEYASLLSTAVITKAVLESEGNQEILSQIDAGVARFTAALSGNKRTVE